LGGGTFKGEVKTKGYSMSTAKRRRKGSQSAGIRKESKSQGVEIIQGKNRWRETGESKSKYSLEFGKNPPEGVGAQLIVAVS